MSEFHRQNLKKRQRNKLKELHNEAPVLFREKYKNVSDNNSLSQLAADSSLGRGSLQALLGEEGGILQRKMSGGVLSFCSLKQ